MRLTVAGVWKYVYRTVDEDMEVIDVYVSDHRDKQSARKFFNKCIQVTGGAPESIRSDSHRGYDQVKVPFPSTRHHRVKCLNNKAESSHVPIQQRYRPMRGFKNFSLLTGLCQCAYRSLLTFLREVVGLKNGVPGVVMAIHTFGEYPDKFHPHLHAIVTDGLFRDTGTFYVMRDVDLSPLENLFRAEVFKFLKKEGKITAELIQKLMAWRHSGFSIDNGVRIKKEDTKGREAIAPSVSPLV